MQTDPMAIAIDWNSIILSYARSLVRSDFGSNGRIGTLHSETFQVAPHGLCGAHTRPKCIDHDKLRVMADLLCEFEPSRSVIIIENFKRLRLCDI